MKKRMILFLYFCIVTYVVINISQYIEKLQYSSNYSDRPLMLDSVYFIIDSESEKIDLSFIREEGLLDDYTILSVDAEDTYRYHVVYTKGKNDIFYGNVPAEWDFDGSESGAIIGRASDVSDLKVLGYIVDDGIYAKEHAVFQFDRKISQLATGDIFALACGKPGEASKRFTIFAETCRQKGIVINPVNMLSAVFGQYSENEPVIYLVGIVFWIVVIFLAAVAAHLWCSSNRNYYRVLYMFGAKHPYISVLRGFLVTSLAAFFIQLTLYLIFNNSSYIVCKYTVILSVLIYFSQYIVLLLRRPGI